MESWTKAELNYVRVLRHPCLVSDLQTRDVSAWTRANNGVTTTLPCLRPSWRGSHRDPSKKSAATNASVCRRTFTETRDTPFYRMHKPKWLVVAVVTLLAYGCPLQAIVAAFEIDERTVARWQRESGLQCKRVHEHMVEAGRV